MSCYWVRLGGWLPATEIAPHSAPTWETLANGGTGEVSFEFAMSPKVQHQLLATGVKVEVMLAAQPVATALMSEPDRTEWAIKAQGLAASAYKVGALTPTGETTRDVGVALFTAIESGWWPVTNPGDVGAALIVSGDDTGPMTVGQLLDAAAEQVGMRWGVDGAGRVYMRADPVTPTCMISPGVAAFGVTDEDRATQIVARYQTTGGTNATRIYPPTVNGPVIHEITDRLLERGALTEAQVDEILAGALALGKGRNRWTNGVELADVEITRRGAPASLPILTAGVDMARVTGLSSGSAPWEDVVIGKTRYTAGAPTIYVEPVNTAPRNLVDVIAAA